MSIEKQILGSLIANPDKFVEVSEIINENSFIDEDVRNIFTVFKKLYESGSKISLFFFRKELTKRTCLATLPT